MIENLSEKIIFEYKSNGQLIPLYASGIYSECIIIENDISWIHELPAPPNIGIWTWEYSPIYGIDDDADIDYGDWRILTEQELLIIKNGKNS